MVETLKDKILKTLIQSQGLKKKDVDEAVALQKKKGISLDKALIEKGFIRERDLLVLLVRELNIPFISLGKYTFDPSLKETIPERIARQYHIIPLSALETTVTIAISDPLNVFAIDDLESIAKCKIKSALGKKQDIIIDGPTGSGKSFISCALGNQACIYGFTTLYYNARKVFSKLKQLKADNSHIKELRKIERADLLIIDDFGIEKLDTQNRLNLLEIIEDRHGLKSTILVSQLPATKWHDVIGDHTIADAICDRVIHSSLKIKLKGDSMRKKQKNRKK